MKGIVFSFKHRERENRHRYISRFSFKRFFSFYGIQCFFMLTFILGIVLGSCYFRSASPDLLSNLDVLFITNLDNRLKLSAFDIFCSSFASHFLFIFASFLLSFTAWGMFALPLLCAFRGFGVGISSAYMFASHAVTGIGFFILVVLPGTVLFLFAFITALKESFTQSIYLLKMYLPSARDVLLYRYIKATLFRYFVVTVFSAFSAIIDMLLWVLFANMFNF